MPCLAETSTCSRSQKCVCELVFFLLGLEKSFIIYYFSFPSRIIYKNKFSLSFPASLASGLGNLTQVASARPQTPPRLFRLLLIATTWQVLNKGSMWSQYLIGITYIQGLKADTHSLDPNQSINIYSLKHPLRIFQSKKARQSCSCTSHADRRSGG